MAAERLRVAVIGVGAFGEQHVRALRGGEGWDLVAVADADGERARQVADRYGVRAWFADPWRMLQRCRLDAVSVATTFDHVPLAAAAVRHGCAVLLEKPVAETAADVDALLALEGADRIQPGHILRCHPTFVALRERVRDGMVGRVVGVSAQRDRECGHTERYGAMHPVLLTSVHDIDLALWITEARPVRVSAHAVSSGGAGQPDLAHVAVDTADGGVWSVRTSWLLPAGHGPVDRFEVYGTHGVAGVEVSGSTAQLRVEGMARNSQIDEVDEVDLLRVEFARLRDRMSDSPAPPLVTMAEARDGLVVAEAAIRSAARGGAVIDVGSGTCGATR